MPMTGATAAIWLSDGVDDPGAAALAKYLADGAGLRYLAADEGAEPRLLAAGTAPPSWPEGSRRRRALAAGAAAAPGDRAGQRRGRRAAWPASRRRSTPAPTSVAVRLAMPPELRNRMTRRSRSRARTAPAASC